MPADGHLRFFIAAILAVFLLVGSLSCDREPAPKAGTHTVARLPGETIDGYLLWIPEGYDRSRAWPIILALGEAGWTERAGALDPLAGPARAAERADRKELDFLRREFLILTPRFPEVGAGEEGPWEERADRVMKLLDDVARAYRGDPRRIYLTGTGGGACGVWLCLGRYADRFAAAAPLDGFAGASRIAIDASTSGAPLRDLPLWIIRNGGDPSAPSKRVIDTVKRIESLGGDRFVRVDDLGELREAPRARRILSIRVPEAARARDLYESPHLYRWMLRWKREER